MPADERFVRIIKRAIRARRGRLLEAPEPDAASNPFSLQFDLSGTLYGALIHVRRTTPQEGATTSHGRPEGEWHTQMIYDGDGRGAGRRHYLRTDPDLATVLFGYATIGADDETVIAAWDPVFHADYSYSKSLQIREETLQEANDTGLAEQSRQTGEIIVAFRPEFLPDYLANKSHWHGTIPTTDPEEREGEDEGDGADAPPDKPGQRGVKRLTGTRAARDVRFRGYIHDNYTCCATCGLEAESLLEAAHIIPVSDDGSDHYSNGLRLCKNCHALFDSGLLLIRPSYEIELSREVAAAYPEDTERLRTHLMEELRLPDIPQEYRPDSDKLRRVLEERWQERLA